VHILFKAFHFLFRVFRIEMRLAGGSGYLCNGIGQLTNCTRNDIDITCGFFKYRRDFFDIGTHISGGAENGLGDGFGRCCFSLDNLNQGINGMGGCIQSLSARLQVFEYIV